MGKMRRYLSNSQGSILIYTLVIMLFIITAITSVLMYKGAAQVSQNFEILDSTQKRDVLSLEQEVKSLDNLHLYETTHMSKEMNGDKYSVEITPTGKFDYDEVTHKSNFQWNQTKNSYIRDTAKDPYTMAVDGTGTVQNLVGPRISSIVTNPNNTHDSIVSYSDDYIPQYSVLAYDGKNSVYKPSSADANKFRYRIDKGEWSAFLDYTDYNTAINTALTDANLSTLLQSSIYGFISFEFYKGKEKVGWNRETLVSGVPTYGFQNGQFIVDNYNKALRDNRGINQKASQGRSNLMYYISTLPNSSDLVTTYSHSDLSTKTFIETGEELNNLTSSELTTVMQLTYDRVCLGFKSVSPLNNSHWSKLGNATDIYNNIKDNTIGISDYTGSICDGGLNNNTLNYSGNYGSTNDGEDTIINGYSRIPISSVEPIKNYLEQSNNPGVNLPENTSNPKLKLKTNLNAYETLTGVDKPSMVSYSQVDGGPPKYLSTLLNAMGANASQYFNAQDLTWVASLASKIEGNYSIQLTPTGARANGDSEFKTRFYCDDSYTKELSQYLSMVKYVEHRMKWLQTRQDYVDYLKRIYDETVATGTQPPTMSADDFFEQDGWTAKGTQKGIERSPETPPTIPCISDVNRDTVLTEFKEDEVLSINLATAIVNNANSDIEVIVNYSEDIQKAKTDWSVHFADNKGNTKVASKNNKDITISADEFTFSKDQTNPLTVPFKRNYDFLNLNKLNADSIKKGNTVPAYINIVTSNIKINSIEYKYGTIVGAEYDYVIKGPEGQEVRKGKLELKK